MKIYKHLCSRIIGVLAGLVLALLSSQVFAAIDGSAHDFAASVAWNDTGEMCVTCHAPHNPAGATDGPLWNHTLSAEAAYGIYTSPTGTLDGVIGQPGGASKLCLSCHDGTIGLDSFGGNGIALDIRIGTINAAADLGTNLANDHPISITYIDPGLAPTTNAVTIGDGVTKVGTVGSELVPSGSVECSSCHDVHNTYTFATTPLLKMTMADSALCQACHAK